MVHHHLKIGDSGRPNKIQLKYCQLRTMVRSTVLIRCSIPCAIEAIEILYVVLYVLYPDRPSAPPPPRCCDTSSRIDVNIYQLPVSSVYEQVLLMISYRWQVLVYYHAVEDILLSDSQSPVLLRARLIASFWNFCVWVWYQWLFFICASMYQEIWE